MGIKTNSPPALPTGQIDPKSSARQSQTEAADPDVCTSGDDASETDIEDDDCEDEEDERLSSSFARWLATKQPLFRFEHAARGKAWDYPLAKAEKKELLILHFSVAEQHAARGPGGERQC